MAINLGRGGVERVGEDASNLLSTGAMFRQQAEQNTKAQAGLILQELREEADNRGWSMRRMAEAYPTQFKAASAALYGGGQRGIAAADTMWSETIGGPETEEQYMQFAKDRDFAAANPEGTPYVTWEQEITAQTQAIAEGRDPTTAKAEEDSTASRQTSFANITEALQAENGIVSIPFEQRKAFIAQLEEQAAAGNTWAAKKLEKFRAAPLHTNAGGMSGPQNEAIREALTELNQSFDEEVGQFGLWTNQTEATTGAPTTVGLPVNRSEYSEYMSETLAQIEAGETPSSGLTVPDKISMNRFQGFLDDESVPPAAKEMAIDYLRARAEGRTADELAQDPAFQMEIDGRPWRIGRYVSQQTGRGARGQVNLESLPYPAPRPQETPGQQLAAPLDFSFKPFEETTPEQPTEEQVGGTGQVIDSRVGGMVGYQAERDRAIEAGASPANRRYQEILAGRAAETAIEKDKALTSLYGAQEATALGNLELAYANAGSDIQALSNQYDKVHIDSAQQAYEDYVSRLQENDVPTPPPAAIGNAEAFTTWFDDLNNRQQRAYVDATTTMAKLVPTNPALSASFSITPVDYKSGLFNFGGSQATVIVPRSYDAGRGAMTSQQFIAQLMDMVNP